MECRIWGQISHPIYSMLLINLVVTLASSFVNFW
jgi:hypothetical protein